MVLKKSKAKKARLVNGETVLATVYSRNDAAGKRCCLGGGMRFGNCYAAVNGTNNVGLGCGDDKNSRIKP